MINKLAFVSLALLIAGCGATNLNMDDPTAVASGIKVSVDEYSKKETITGPLITNPNKTGMITWGAQEYLLSKTEESIVLVLSDSFPGWRHYYKAIDIDGNEMEFSHLGKQVTKNCNLGTCLVIEKVGISLSEEYLSTRMKSGLDIKIYGDTSTVLKVSGTYVSTFLEAID